jgi:cytidylate kinase
MKKFITISREYGSGGHHIGKMVAEKMGYKFYDKELIALSAEESGLAPEFVEKTEQNLPSGWFYNLMLGSSYTAGSYSSIQTTTPQILPLADQVFNAQRKTIVSLAQKGPCVIVGRCADYILKSSELIDCCDIMDVFLYAELETEIKRAIELHNVPENEAKKFVIQTNKRRANHYNTFTENTWGDRLNYDLMLNTTYIANEVSTDIICQYAREC